MCPNDWTYTPTHTYLYNIYVFCVYIYIYPLDIFIYIYSFQYLSTCCLGPHFCDWRSSGYNSTAEALRHLPCKGCSRWTYRWMESCNYFINKWWNTNCKHTVTHAHTFLYAIYHILFQIYVFHIFIHRYTAYTSFFIIRIPIFAWRHIIRVDVFFGPVRDSFDSWPWIPSIQKMVWSSYRRCSIVVFHSDVDLCACPPWQVRGEYQFFTFESYDLCISSFVTTFQCENTREGALSCAFRLELVVEHFHQEYFFNVQVRLCSGHPEVEGRLGQKDFKIPDVEGTTMVYHRCVSNLQNTTGFPTRRSRSSGPTLKMNDNLFGMSRLCWKIFDQMIMVGFWMLEKIQPDLICQVGRMAGYSDFSA